MARMVLDEDGRPTCPRCGSREMRRKSVLEWGSAKVACVACGKGLQPASRRDQKRAKRARQS